MSDDEERRPKRAKKPPKHECTVVLLDVGPNMADPVPGTSVAAIDLAKEVLDWVFTRKVLYFPFILLFVCFISCCLLELPCTLSK